jgi:hypothetical protein
MASDAPLLSSIVEGQYGAQGDPPRPRTDLAGAVWWVAAGVVAHELEVSARYGFHRDELYFIACAHRLVFGYVDQGPLAPALVRAAIDLFGTSLSSVRLFPALAEGAVVGTGLTAGALVGGRFAELLAAVAVGPGLGRRPCGPRGGRRRRVAPPLRPLSQRRHHPQSRRRQQRRERDADRDLHRTPRPWFSFWGSLRNYG